MTEYRCLDCDDEMEREGGLFWNEALTKCFYKFKCINCGSSFDHRLTKEEEDELKQRAIREKEEISKMTRKERPIKIFRDAKQKIRLKLLGLFILLVISATFIIGIIEGSIRNAFVCLFALFLMFVCIGCALYTWESWKKEMEAWHEERKGG